MKNCSYCGSDNLSERERCFACGAPFINRHIKIKSIMEEPATIKQLEVIEKIIQKGILFEKIVEKELSLSNTNSIEMLDKKTACVIIDKMFTELHNRQVFMSRD
jgi:hypothetical protein